MDLPLRIVPDEELFPPPADTVPVVLLPGERVISARRSWQLDAMISAAVVQPGPLCLVTGT